jgi:hypothetical protein
MTADDRVKRVRTQGVRTEGGKDSGAMSMSHSGRSDGSMLRQPGLIV